jgi:phytanoyl-CoA hydroxylase
MIVDFATLDDATEAGDFFRRNEYLVVRNLIPEALVRTALAAFDSDVLPRRTRFLRQSGFVYQRNRIDEHRHVTNSFLQPHKYRRFTEFQESLLAIYTHDTMKIMLRALSGEDCYLGQSMLFDKNTHTSVHRDDFYLDSVPAGRMVAAWIALETIEEAAGRFYVVPSSPQWEYGLNRQESVSNIAYANKMREVAKGIEDGSVPIWAPALAAGDVLFWGSRMFHGSTATTDPRFSRKSLTAHYIPVSHEFGSITGAVYKTELRSFNDMLVDFSADVHEEALAQLRHNVTVKFQSRYPSLFLALVQAKRAIFGRRSA